MRDNEFDAGELAIVTYLQAKTYNKPYVMLPGDGVSGVFGGHQSEWPHEARAGADQSSNFGRRHFDYPWGSHRRGRRRHRRTGREKARAMLPLAAKKLADETARIEAIRQRKDLRAPWLDAALRAAGVLKDGERL